MHSANTIKIQSFLTRTPILWISGVLYLIMTLAFAIIMKVWDFQVIDEMFIKADILAHIEAMSAEQQRVHAMTTATLDVAYPFAYGIFQAGMAYRYLGSWGKWIAPLSLICIPFDLTEGFSQVMLLTGSLQYVELKTVVTPIKLALFTLGLVAAVVALAIAFKSKRAM